MDSFEHIAQNIGRIRQEMGEVCVRHGRLPQSVGLMVVTKTQPWAAVEAALACKPDAVGENRVQEMLERFPPRWPSLDTPLYFIGHLQSNKVAKAAAMVQGVMSVDNSRTAERLAQVVQAPGVMEVWVECNTSGEPSKNGVTGMDDLLDLVEGILGLAPLHFRGLMTLGPLGDNERASRAAFAQLRIMARNLEDRGLGRDLGLSMGMSDDWPWAVAEGATMIRVGTRIFGARK